MRQSIKNKKQLHVKRRVWTRVSQPDQNILDSIGSPNAWTPEVEDAWLKELRKISVREIYSRFPPMKKPNNVSRRGKNSGG